MRFSMPTAPRMTRSLRNLTALAGVFVLLLTGCAPEPPPPPPPAPVSTEITVTGPGDEAPTIDLAVPFPAALMETKVLWDANGERIEDGEPILLRMYAVDGGTGQVQRNDFDSIPGVYRMDPEEIGTQLYDALMQVTTGSRVQLVSPLAESSLVTVVDVFAAHATGDPNEMEPGLPQVTYGPGQVPALDMSDLGEPPAILQVQQLKIGRGEQVAAHDLVLLQFVAATWATGEVFDTTWGPETLPVAVTIGTDTLIQGLEESLIGVPIGSQIMVVVPPDLGFGPSENELSEDTLVYVVDVLAASSPTSQDTETTQGPDSPGETPPGE